MVYQEFQDLLAIMETLVKKVSKDLREMKDKRESLDVLAGEDPRVQKASREHQDWQDTLDQKAWR